MGFATKAIRDSARKRIAQQVKAGEPCALCRKPIDLALRFPHPDSFVVDHIVPTSRGGTDNYESLQPAHNLCNTKRGDNPLGTIGVNSGALER